MEVRIGNYLVIKITCDDSNDLVRVYQFFDKNGIRRLADFDCFHKAVDFAEESHEMDAEKE